MIRAAYRLMVNAMDWCPFVFEIVKGNLWVGNWVTVTPFAPHVQLPPGGIQQSTECRSL
jgi:hypothetical protein